MLLTTTGGYFVYRHLNGNIHHIGGIPLPKHHGKTVNYLIIGSDNRQVPGGAAFGAHQTENLSDTVILAHLSGDGKNARLVSFPRDMLTDIPSCKRWNGRTGTTDPRTDKFNVAYALGGPACTIKTVEAISGITVDDFIVVSLPGFVQISNALGGVEVCVPNAVNDKQSSIYLPAGRYKVKGVQALGFVRERDQLGGSRIRRQQEFLGSAVKSATRSGLLLNPPKLYHLLDVTTKAITTGKLSLNDLRKVAEHFQHIKPGNVTFYTVPTFYERLMSLPNYPNRVYVDPMDKVSAAALFAEIKAGAPVVAPTPTATSSVQLVVPASHVPIRVLNGTSVKGAASRAADALRSAGFNVVSTGDADASTYTQTIVRYGAQRVQSSQTLNAAVPGSVRQYDAGLGNVVQLIVGSSFSGAHTVTVGGATPQPSASPAPVKGFTAEEDPCSANKGGGGPA
jgi:LCP family protein required for cell wall assembly